jgi:hypothetical protein
MRRCSRLIQGAVDYWSPAPQTDSWDIRASQQWAENRDGTAPQIHPVSFVTIVSVVLDIVINIRNHIEIVGFQWIAIFIGEQ